MQKLVLESQTKHRLREHIKANRMRVPEPHKLDLSNGCIVVSCADGDQIVHVVEQVTMMATVQSHTPRPLSFLLCSSFIKKYSQPPRQ